MLNINKYSKLFKISTGILFFLSLLAIATLLCFQYLSQLEIALLSGLPFKARSDKESQCIPTDFSAAYPVGMQAGQGERLNFTQILPITPWHLKTSIPKMDKPQKEFVGELLLTRTIGEKDEIWISGGVINLLDDTQKTGDPTGLFQVSEIKQAEPKILVIDSTSKTWTMIDRKIAKYDTYIFDAFVDQKGDVWGLGSKDLQRKKLDAPIILAKYQEDLNQFILPEKTEHPSIGYLPSKLIDPNGNYWFFTTEYTRSGSLYSFNLLTQQMQIYGVETSKYFNQIQSLQISPKGELFLRSYATKDLIHFNPVNGKVELEKILPLTDDFSGVSHVLDNENYLNTTGTQIYLTPKGRLWVEDYGFKEPDGRWYQLLHRSPDFFVNGEGLLQYIWLRPEPILESKDGLLWFKGTHGLTRLDPISGEWCKMTTLPISTILEDQSGDLWIMVKNDIYVLDIKK